MNKLNQKDDLQMAAHGATQETQILSDYLGELESLVVKFENDRTQDNMIALAYEVTRSIGRLQYLNDNALDKLNLIEDIVNVEEV
ncbi:hypothetical protein [Aerococcus sp.]|uniref:hypothetical protein n=1 Tax=Aerococcus sp. TaxID=1872398 RepID=UPI0025B834C7|nr:hypothetical protein [Aerococcus sp.]MBR2130365.1 hypothetical protein [Aerococcus sp.]